MSSGWTSTPALLALLLAACAEPSAADSDPVPVDTDAWPTPFERDLAPLLHACTGCHGGDLPQGELDLTDLRAATLEVSATQLDMPLIQPGDHLESYLWHKVNGSQGIAGGAGARMPVGAIWSEEDVALLARWIDLGAEP